MGACGSPAEAPQSTTAPATIAPVTAAPDCNARRGALGHQLAEMRTGAASVPPSFLLPVVPAVQDFLVEALPVANDGTGWQIDGHATTTPVDDLRAHADRLRLIASHVPSSPFTGRIQLALGRGLSVADALVVLDHLDEVGFNWVTLLVTDTAEVPPSHAPAMPAWVSESLTNPQPDRQSALDRDFTRASGSCTQLASLYQTSREISGLQFATLLNGLPEALPQCACDGTVDFDAVASILFEEYELRGPNVHGLDMVVYGPGMAANAPGAEPTDVPLAPDATVAELVAAVAALPEERGRVVRFVVGGLGS